MKKFSFILFLSVFCMLFLGNSCETDNETALKEQEHTEKNQNYLNSVQPAPTITWSLERDNLIKRFALMNDQTVEMYMYIFIEGVGQPIGYYIINKVSSVNSQLTNPFQLIDDPNGNMSAGSVTLPSPAEDGSYGTNGDGVFGFTPDGLYIEKNMKYIVSTAPLKIEANKIGEISVEVSQKLKGKLTEIEKIYYVK